MHLATVELSQTDALVAVDGLEQEAAQQFDGVGALLVDVVAGVTAYKSFYLSTQEEIACGNLSALEAELGGSVATTGTADKDFAFVLRVQIDEIVARHKAGLHALGTSQSGLFVAGEDALNRTMLNVAAVQHGQFHGTAYAVVGAQRGALSRQPLAVNIGLDGVVVEINLIVHQFVTHHVHVALQNHRLAVLHAFGGRFTDDDVARLVDLGRQSATLAPLFQVGYHLLFTLRRAWNLVNLRKLLEDYCWF